MKRKRLIRFVLGYALIGILTAALIITVAPGILGPTGPSINLLGRDPVALNGALRDGPVSYAHAVERAAPAVVNIYTTKRVRHRPHPLEQDPFFRRFFDGRESARERQETSLGSGVIFSEEGYVLTNFHVIRNADEIQVLLSDARTSEAKVVGTDPETDLAVLALPLKDLPAIPLGGSETLRVGDVVLAIGNPFGVGQTVTKGIVSATGRTQLGLSTFENFIQTDAAINPGNSGGALINANGELVGINTAIFTGSGGSHGIGFAIPSDLARTVLASIVEHGRVVRGWAGIEVQSLTPPLAESFGLSAATGVIVAGVLREGPAHRAGLRPGDIILGVQERAVTDARTLMHTITALSPGTTVALEAWRNGERFTTALDVEERPENAAGGH